MSVKVSQVARHEGPEGLMAHYMFEYESADGETRLSVGLEADALSASGLEVAAKAIASGKPHRFYAYSATGEAETWYEVREGGTIAFGISAFGGGCGGCLSASIPAAPWEEAFREVAWLAREG